MQWLWYRGFSNKTLRMVVVSRKEYILPPFEHVTGFSVMDGFGCEQSDAGVAVFLIVPVEEGLTKSPCIFKGAESFREIGSVLEGLELRFGKRVVVAGVRPAVGFCNAQVA